MRFQLPRMGFLFVACATLLCASDRPTAIVFPEITLADGRSFTHAELKTFGATGVVVKHDDGLVQVAYTLLPETVRSKVAPQITEAIALAKASAAPKHSGNEGPDTAADNRAKAALGETLLNGRCFVSDGAQPRGIRLVEVRVYPAAGFSSMVDEIEKRVNPRWTELEEMKKEAESHRDLVAVAEANKEQQALNFSKWDQLPAPAAAVKTDEEGRFSLTHRLKGEFLVVARASVKTSSDSRNFVWIVSSKTIADPNRVFLTNDNAL